MNRVRVAGGWPVDEVLATGQKWLNDSRSDPLHPCCFTTNCDDLREEGPQETRNERCIYPKISKKH